MSNSSRKRKRRANAGRNITASKQKNIRPETVDIRAEVVKAQDDVTDSGVMKFKGTAYRGGVLKVFGFMDGIVVDLAGMSIPESIPAAGDHSSALESRLGTMRATGADGELVVEGEIVPGTPQADRAIALLKAGAGVGLSIGARPTRIETVEAGEEVDVNGQKHNGPVEVARASELLEVSFVGIGADRDAGAVAARSNTQKAKGYHDMDFEKWIEAKGFDLDSLTEDGRQTLRAQYDYENDPESNADKPVKAKAEAPEVKADVDSPTYDIQAYRDAQASETDRVSKIREICAGQHDDIESRAIKENWDANKTELEVLRANRPQITGVRSDDGSGNARAIEAALCLSAGLSESEVGKHYDEQTMNAAMSSDYRDMSLHGLIHATARAAGEAIRGHSINNDAIRTAFEADRKLQASGAAFSTVSLSGITSNLANKSMLAGYNAVQSIAPKIARETTANDFKEHTRYRMTGTGLFEKVAPDGELKHNRLTEESYTNQVDTYGELLTLTRQMIVNDDLNAFTQIAQSMGRKSRLTLEKALFELILSNPSSFFSAGNNNFSSGAATALSFDSLSTAEQGFMDQTDSAGNPILVMPKMLLVPTSLKSEADRLMRSTTLNETTSADSPAGESNIHAGKFEVVSTPYLNAQSLSGSSSLAWYLLADPSDIAPFEIAYLRGRRVPVIESGETDFSNLGMKWRGYFDFGVAMQDTRGAYKMKGEA